MTVRTIWQELQTIFIAALVAALLWLYAENEDTKFYKLALDVRLVAPANRSLYISPDTSIPVTVSLRCSASQFALLQQRYARGAPFMLAVTEDPAKIEKTASLRDLLQQDRRLTDLGVILDVQPESLTMVVERMTTRKLRVVVDPGNLETDGPPTPSVAEAVVTLRQSLADQLDKDKEAHLTARFPGRLLDAARVGTLEFGKQQTVEATLLPPPGYEAAGVAIEPPRVSLTFTPVQRTDTWEDPLVLVQVQGPLNELSKYTVTAKKDNVVVTLTGPRAIIGRLRDHKLLVTAFLPFGSGDLEKDAGKGDLSKPVEFGLPAGVTVVGQPPTIGYSVTKNVPPAAPPAASP
jgi:hypothetical protein